MTYQSLLQHLLYAGCGRVTKKVACDLGFCFVFWFYYCQSSKSDDNFFPLPRRVARYLRKYKIWISLSLRGQLIRVCVSKKKKKGTVNQSLVWKQYLKIGICYILIMKMHQWAYLIPSYGPPVVYFPAMALLVRSIHGILLRIRP